MSKAQILVVDDTPANRKLVADLLGWEGYDVVQAIDAVTALAAIERSLPDLILMDIGLPDMDGLTLTRQLKGADRTKHIPIIALTAFAMKGDAERALAAGCDGYIAKPIDTRHLPGDVTQWLQKNITQG
jgi:CheY-like chemotaxis protein